MVLTMAQFDTHHVVWSENHVAVEKVLRDLVYKNGLSWDEATTQAITEIDTSVLDDYSSLNNSCFSDYSDFDPDYYWEGSQRLMW